MQLPSVLLDRKSRLARLWSNQELARVAGLFQGDVVNVSGWRDDDKFGRTYRSYFSGARSYTITNYVANARGWQGGEDEVFLDLSQPLPERLRGAFDIVFNHTVLEHIYEARTAFANLCALTTDIVLLVVPFLQPMHAEYGDYWRFTPLAVKNMFEENDLTLLALTFNSHVSASVYLFAVASRHPERWPLLVRDFTYVDPRIPRDSAWPFVGTHAILNPAVTARRTLSALRRRGGNTVADPAGGRDGAGG
jgi:hypothetical protein